VKICNRSATRGDYANIELVRSYDVLPAVYVTWRVASPAISVTSPSHEVLLRGGRILCPRLVPVGQPAAPASSEDVDYRLPGGRQAREVVCRNVPKSCPWAAS
jgi:hypothetical protein